MTPLDWSIVVAYLGAILALGVLVSRGVKGSLEYFLAGRNLGIWTVAISIIATETSAATVIGGPDTAFRSDLAYLQTTIGAVLSRFFLAYFFIDVYYRHRVFTVYEYLKKRYSRAVQFAAALLFSLGRLLASGARLYIASFAVASISGLSLLSSIGLVGLIAVIYGVLGGLRAVVITDILQGILFLGAGLWALFFLISSVGGISAAAAALSGTDKCLLFDFNVDIFSASFWANPYTFIGALIGGFTLGVATHGTDQDMVQRMLACRTSREGRRSVIIAGLLEIPVALLFVGLGLALWLFYQQAAASAPPATESVFPYFIRTQIPSGLRGLLLAAILAAAMSSLDSALTALSSVTVRDLLPGFSRKDQSERQELRVSRFFSLVWGVLLIGAAIVIGLYHQELLLETAAEVNPGRRAELLTVALGVMSVVYGPLLGVFLVGIFTVRGSTISLLLGMCLGLLTTVVLQWGQVVDIGWTWYVLIGAAVTVGVGVIGRGGVPRMRRQGK